LNKKNKKKYNIVHFLFISIKKMNPSIWGPPMWISLHTITLNYPDNPSQCQQKMIREFFWNLQYVLPCEMCRNHYAEMIRTHPPDTKNKKSLVYWLIDRHNQVNERLGKRIYTYEEVLKKYQDLYNQKDKLNAIFELSKETDQLGVSCSENQNNNKNIYMNDNNNVYQKYKMVWIGIFILIILGIFLSCRKNKK
jgi:hypothetical protein